MIWFDIFFHEKALKFVLNRVWFVFFSILGIRSVLHKNTQNGNYFINNLILVDSYRTFIVLNKSKAC